MTVVMDVSLTRLPRLLMVLVLAFAPFEPRPMLAAVELFRGMALQLSYRWATGGVLAEDSDRAVLLWTDCAPTTRRDLPREALGVLVSVATGLVLFVACNTLLLVELRRMGLTEAQINEAAQLYLSGTSLAKLGQRFGCDHTTVRRALLRREVTMRTSSER